MLKTITAVNSCSNVAYTKLDKKNENASNVSFLGTAQSKHQYGIMDARTAASIAFMGARADSLPEYAAEFNEMFSTNGLKAINVETLENGNTRKTYKCPYFDTSKMTREITPQGKTAEIVSYKHDGNRHVAKFWENGKRKSWEIYGKDDLRWYLSEYNKQGIPTKGTRFASGSESIREEETLYRTNGKPETTRLFLNDGETLEEMTYYDDQGNKSYTEVYEDDGKTVEFVRKYDS